MNFLMVPSKLCKSCPTTTCMCFPQPCSSFNREMYPKKSCSKWTKNDANRLDIVKCGANLVLDRKVGFSQNQVSQKKMLFNPVQPHMAGCAQWAVRCGDLQANLRGLNREVRVMLNRCGWLCARVPGRWCSVGCGNWQVNLRGSNREVRVLSPC